MMNVDPSSAGAPAAALIVCALFLWPFGVRAPAAETPAVAPAVHASGGIPPLWQTLPPTPALPEGTHGHTLAVDGARLWYATWGTPSKRTPVVLLHGGKGNSNYFGDLIPILTAHGYRVIAMDSRGHGRSTRTDEPMTYHLMAEDVVHLLDALHLPRVSLVGWSDGGIIGIDMGLNHPDRVARLFAFGANVNLAGERDDVLESPTFNAYLARVHEEYLRLSPTPARWNDFDAAMNRMWTTQPDYSTEAIRALQVPTTIADGDHDEGIKQEHARYMAATIPHARLVIIPGTSHFAMLQDPHAFADAVLDFLQWTDGRR